MKKVWTYSLRKPDNETVTQLIGQNNYTYIVATKAMERERYKLIPAEQMNRNNKPIAVFQDVISLWLEKVGEPVARKSDTNLLLRRAIDTVTKQDPQLADILKTDLSSWLKALADLAEEGIQLSHGWDPQKYNALVNPFVGDLLVKLQKAYYDELGNSGKVLFEDAARRYFRQQYRPAPVILLEGFTYLTKLQRLYVKECIRLGARVHFIVPFREEQPRAFEQIRQTYADVTDWTRLPEHPITKEHDLQALQTEFLNLSNYPVPVQGNSIRMVSFPSRDREMLACINQISEWLQVGYKPDQIAIVMRSPSDFKEQFRDMLHLHPIKYRDQDGNLHQISMARSPRLLLLTPVGRFILTLYQIWKNNQLDMSADNFESIVSSGWLGVELQDSTSRFRAIKPQRFSHLRSFREWNQALDELRANRDSSGRLPEALALQEEIDRWKETVKALESVCRKLISTNGTFKDHIRILQNELESIMPENIRKSEQEVLNQIRDAFRELENADSFPITTDEFGASIHAIARAANNDEEEEVEEDPIYSDTLRIVSPESIDGQNYACVWYIGVDNVRVPRSPSLPWPFFEDDREQHLNKERYMFVTVLRSIQSQAVFSYAREDAGHSYQASIYLREIERKFSQRLINHEWKDMHVSLQAPEITVGLPSYALGLRETFYLNEIAHYGLCPIRYHLETLHPEADVYRSEWQLTKAVQGVWLANVLELLTKERRLMNVSQILEKAIQVKQGVKLGLYRKFPSFDAVSWEEVEQRVQEALENMFSFNNYPKQVLPGMPFSWKVPIEERNNFIEVTTRIPYVLRSGKIEYPIMNSDLHQEFLLPGKKNSGPSNEENGLGLFNSQYHAVQWWRNIHRDLLTIKRDPENSMHSQEGKRRLNEANKRIGYWVEMIRDNHFPKRPGDHCRSCSVRFECLGLHTETIQEVNG